MPLILLYVHILIHPVRTYSSSSRISASSTISTYGAETEALSFQMASKGLCSNTSTFSISTAVLKARVSMHQPPAILTSNHLCVSINL